MAPSANWLTEAVKPFADPIFVFRLPDIGASGIYFSSHPGHYSDGAGGLPHHAGKIDAGGLPVITRKIQNIFTGRSVTTIGKIKLIDNGGWDTYFGDHNITIRGTRLHGFVTFPGLAWGDAVQYLTARVMGVETNDRGDMTLSLRDEKTFEMESTRLTAGTFTSLQLGDVVKARLTSAGLVYPDDYDTTAWNAWIASGKPGAFTVTGSWSEGHVFQILDRLLAGTLTWHTFRRDGKFYIEQFADLGGAPPVDVNLEDTSSLFDGGKTEIYDRVFRQQTIKYAAGGSSIVKTVNLSTSHNWWPTAKEGKPIDPGIDGSADAMYLVDDRLALLSSEHVISELIADARMLAYNLGATIELTLGLKNLPAISPKYHRVFEIEEDPNDGETKLKVWTKLGGPPLP